MRISSIYKNLIILLSILITIAITSFFWDKIILPLKSPLEVIGPLSIKGYNPSNDTIRYLFFTIPPLSVFFLLKIFLKGRVFSLNNLFFEKFEEVKKNNSVFLIPFIIFIILAFFQFLSLDLFNYRLDTFHDGDFLTPAHNYISNNELWLSSYTVHGGSDIFYPVFMWKLLGIESIGAARFSFIFLIFLLKLLLIVLSYQFSKTLFFNSNKKVIFFVIFTSILIMMSDYTVPLNYSYFSYRDIFIILFLIFFIELFISNKFQVTNSVFISLIATVSLIFHIDIGFYLNFILFCYLFYLLIIKKYKELIVILISIITFWLILINIIGFEEFAAFLNHTKNMILSVDLMHGLKHPTPFFSINEVEYGTRATRGLLLQITAGLFILNYLFLNKEKISNSKKMFFVFLFLLSFIMYKNALGRSDSNHLRMSADIPILINCFFILNYFLIYIEKKFNNIFSKRNSYFFVYFMIILFIFINIKNYNINKIINYNKNFYKYINLKDESFIDTKTNNFLEYFGKINSNSYCVQIFTFDLALPYLLKKPSCTKYFSSWLASPIDRQKDYILNINKIKPIFILYQSKGKNFDLTYKPEPPEVFERLTLVNSYILDNYSFYKQLDDYIIFKRLN